MEIMGNVEEVRVSAISYTSRAKDKRSPKETPLSLKKVSEFIYRVVCKNFHTLQEGIGDLPIVWLKKKTKKPFSKISVSPPPELLSTLCTLHLHDKYQSNLSTQVVLHVALYISVCWLLSTPNCAIENLLCPISDK